LKAGIDRGHLVIGADLSNIALSACFRRPTTLLAATTTTTMMMMMMMMRTVRKTTTPQRQRSKDRVKGFSLEVIENRKYGVHHHFFMRTLPTLGLALPSSVPMFSKVLLHGFIFDQFDDGSRSDVWSPPQDDFVLYLMKRVGATQEEADKIVLEDQRTLVTY
jgi:hypothetical protein